MMDQARFQREFNSAYKSFGGDEWSRKQIELTRQRAVVLMEVLAGFKIVGLIDEATSAKECLAVICRAKDRADRELISITDDISLRNRKRRTKVDLGMAQGFLNSLLGNLITRPGNQDIDVAVADDFTLYELITFLADLVEALQPVRPNIIVPLRKK